jgi:hypothetical protein
MALAKFQDACLPSWPESKAHISITYTKLNKCSAICKSRVFLLGYLITFRKHLNLKYSISFM